MYQTLETPASPRGVPRRLGRGRRAARARDQPQRPEDGPAKEGLHCSELHKWLSHLGGDEADGGRTGEGTWTLLAKCPKSHQPWPGEVPDGTTEVRPVAISQVYSNTPNQTRSH